MHQLKERKFLDENIEIHPLFPKEYYNRVFREIIEEIKDNEKQISK
ncbi:MAG: hypothetical protein ACFFB4_15030 [Promethearchaeota archaeon]